MNDAINDLLIEEEDYKTLRDSVETHDNYDAVDLAGRLEKHELVFFRQIAASIYRKSKRWEKSISLSKQDKLYKDAIETAAISNKSDVVEDLLRYVCFLILPPGIIYEKALTLSSLLILEAANATSACFMRATISFVSMWLWSCHGVTTSTITACHS